MRSNIARTWGSESLPLVSTGAGAVMAGLPELREKVDELDELLRVLLLQSPERRHRRGGAGPRARDRVAGQAAAAVREVRRRSRVAVLADLVAALTTRLGCDQLAGRVLRRRLQGDLARRAGERALDGQVGHQGDHRDAGERG